MKGDENRINYSLQDIYPIKTQPPAPPPAQNPTVPLRSCIKRTESALPREVPPAAAILNTGEPEGASV